MHRRQTSGPYEIEVATYLDEELNYGDSALPGELVSFNLHEEG